MPSRAPSRFCWVTLAERGPVLAERLSDGTLGLVFGWGRVSGGNKGWVAEMVGVLAPKQHKCKEIPNTNNYSTNSSKSYENSYRVRNLTLFFLDFLTLNTRLINAALIPLDPGMDGFRPDLSIS